MAVPCLAAEPSSKFHLERTEEHHRIIVEHYVDDAHNHKIWLAPRGHPSDRALLYRYGRSVAVLISPDEQWININDYALSDLAEVFLFRRIQGIRYSEVKETQIGQKAWMLFAKEYQLAKPPVYDHE